MPSEERGLAWGEDCVLLCNPFPVLPNHLVLATHSHIPQAIAGRYGTRLDLAGVLVVPEADHLTRIQAQDMARIYAEVTLDAPRFAQRLEHCRDYAGA